MPRIFSLNKVNGFLAAVSSLSAALWFGTSVSQFTIAYELFVPGTSTLRAVDTAVQLQVMSSVSALIIISAISFITLSLTFCLLFVRIRRFYKRNGFLMMCTVISLAAIPLGLSYSWIGIQFYQKLQPLSSAVDGPVLEAVKSTFIALFSSSAWMSLLCMASFVTIVFVLVLRPLQIDEV